MQPLAFLHGQLTGSGAQRVGSGNYSRMTDRCQGARLLVSLSWHSITLLSPPAWASTSAVPLAQALA